MKYRFFLGLACSLTLISTKAQVNVPVDYPSNDFHAGRRELFRSQMPDHSVALIFSYPTRNFSRDVDYEYHPNPDLYYFTGYTEPNAVLVLFKDEQNYLGQPYHDIFFVQKRDRASEMVTGKRLGVEGVKTKLGITMVFEGREFKNFPLALDAQEKILFGRFPTDLGDDISDSTDLFDLLQQARAKAGMPAGFDPDLEIMVGNLPYYAQFGQRAINYINETIRTNEKFRHHPLLEAFLQARDSLVRDSVLREVKKIKYNLYDYSKIINQLRGIKMPEEIALIRKAVEISCMAHREAMKAMSPSMSEREIQGIHEFIHKKYGSEEVGYGSIVGSGNNACILHYEENDRLHAGKQLVLMDVGAEYHGYTADITRTAPANGKFSPEQKMIYDLVYSAQEEILKICREGISFDSLQSRAREVLAAGLKKLGIIRKTDDVDIYYPHGCSHHLGLDVHDRGDYDLLRSGMVITVEPGIYIADSSACDKKWWGIGVRIEDDVLINSRGYELLSALAPRKSGDIEKLMAEKSVLNDFILPDLPASNAHQAGTSKH